MSPIDPTLEELPEIPMDQAIKAIHQVAGQFSCPDCRKWREQAEKADQKYTYVLQELIDERVLVAQLTEQLEACKTCPQDTTWKERATSAEWDLTELVELARAALTDYREMLITASEEPDNWPSYGRLLGFVRAMEAKVEKARHA